MDYQNIEQLGGATKWVEFDYLLSPNQKKELLERQAEIEGLDTVKAKEIGLLIEERFDKSSIGYWGTSSEEIDIEQRIRDIVESIK